MLDHQAHRRSLQRDLKTHCGKGAIRQKKSREKVRCLSNRWGAGDTLQGNAHFVANRDQTVADNLIGNRMERDIGSHHTPFPFTNRLPSSSVEAIPPGGTTTVCPGYSITQGPSTHCPGAGHSVVYTGVSIGCRGSSKTTLREPCLARGSPARGSTGRESSPVPVART